MADFQEGLRYLSDQDRTISEIKSSLLKNHPEFSSWDPNARTQYSQGIFDALKRKIQQEKSQRPSERRRKSPSPDIESGLACLLLSETKIPRIMMTLEKKHAEFQTWEPKKRTKFARKCLESLNNDRREAKIQRKWELRQKALKYPIGASDNPYLTYIRGSECKISEIKKSLRQNHPDYDKWTPQERKKFRGRCWNALLEHRAKKKQSERASQEGGELNQDDDTNEELAQKNDELEAELAEREARISELEEEVADLTAHTTELQDKNSTLKDKNSALKDKKLKLKDDNSRANEENEELNDTVLKLRERKKQLKTEKARANEENEELKAKVAELTDEVLKLKERKKELKKENTKANAEIVELNTELNKRLSMTSTPFRLPSSQNLDMDDDADGQEEAAQLSGSKKRKRTPEEPTVDREERKRKKKKSREQIED
ncbi:hypothetical protein IWZ01DRAFT_554488 [Phyllosticta capitalensis]